MRRGEDLRGSPGCIPTTPSICGLLSLPPPSYKAEVGRVGEAGQVADHEVKVDGADQHHDGGSDNFAHPWE